jgi:hypothetical protein
MEKEHKIAVKVFEKSRKKLQFIRIPSSKKFYLSPRLIPLGDISKMTVGVSVNV